MNVNVQPAGLNKNHASWDYDLLANHFEVPDLIKYGFSTDELEMTMIDEKPKKAKKKGKKKK
jgi:hypothetical protein